jgi:hypothetical protein
MRSSAACEIKPFSGLGPWALGVSGGLVCVDLSRFGSGHLRAILAIK